MTLAKGAGIIIASCFFCIDGRGASCIASHPSVVAGVHNAKAEECTTLRIGSRNIEIKIVA